MDNYLPSGNPQYVIQVKPQYSDPNDPNSQMELNAVVFDKDESVVGQFAHSEVGKVIANPDVVNALATHGVSQDAVNAAVNNALKNILDPKFNFQVNDSTTMHIEVDADRNPGVKVGFTIRF